MATFLGNLPTWLPVCVPRQEEHASRRRACQALALVRRLVLRHCGRLDWEMHSVLFQPHLSFLCRVAQVEVCLVRGVGPTHSLLGPFLSMTPKLITLVLVESFLPWRTVARYQSPTQLWGTGNH